MTTFLEWVKKSSANPEKASLTVKSFLIGLIPAVMKAVGLGCTLALVCIQTDASELQNVALAVSNIVFWVLSIVAAAGVVYGFARKVFLTVAGKNPVLNQ